jgi:hypothetical protein
MLGLGGCRGAERAAPPAVSSPVPAAGSAVADPLTEIEATVDAVERDVDVDADTGASPDPVR